MHLVACDEVVLEDLLVQMVEVVLKQVCDPIEQLQSHHRRGFPWLCLKGRKEGRKLDEELGLYNAISTPALSLDKEGDQCSFF